MPSINFVIKNRKNKGLIMNDKELLSLYFYGIDIVNQQGTSLNVSIIESYIKRAQQEIEKYLTIKLNKQVLEEQSDYYRQEFQGTGYVKTKFPVSTPFNLEGWIGTWKQLTYPTEWLTANKVDGLAVNRQILVVPNSNTSVIGINAAIFAGSVMPHLGLVNSNSIGNYWHLKYITGFSPDSVPYDLLDIIGKMAAISILMILGDQVLGPGISGTSLGIDGLSQSITSTNSSSTSAFGARISMYNKEIEQALLRLKGIYKGITLTSI